MSNNKLNSYKKNEILLLTAVLIFIILHAIIRKDNPIAAVSAFCGITYTFIAGKGNPICYLFGVAGSSFYSLLSFQNALWGNLILYLTYYIPMQVLGYFQWNKNLKKGLSEIIKIKLPKKELSVLVLISLLIAIIMLLVLIKFNDAHPFLDSITTTLSLGGMYLTVRRAIEQWIFWMIVNFLSLLMWINVALTGARVYSTIIMWAVYLFLAIYFYFCWKKDLKENAQ